MTNHLTTTCIVYTKVFDNVRYKAMLMWPDIIVHTYISLYDAIEHLRLGRYFVGMRYFIQKVKYLIFRQCLYILHLGFQLHFHPPPPCGAALVAHDIHPDGGEGRPRHNSPRAHR